MRAAVAAGALCLLMAPVTVLAQEIRPPVPGFLVIAPSFDQSDQGGQGTTTQAPATTQPQGKVHRHVGFKSLFTDLAGDFKSLPSKDTAIWLSAAGALALAAHPIDDNVNARMQGRPWVDKVYRPGKVVGYAWVQMGSSSLTYFYGRVATKPKVAHLAMDLLRAQMMSQALTYGIKVTVRRRRPDHSGGFAFPSGHASDTFATATVLQRHLGWKAAVPMYLVASYVASSRLHDNRHFLSDVIFGSGIGLVSGRTVVRHPSSEYRYWIEPQVGAGRVAIVVARR